MRTKRRQITALNEASPPLQAVEAQLNAILKKIVRDWDKVACDANLVTTGWLLRELQAMVKACKSAPSLLSSTNHGLYIRWRLLRLRRLTVRLRKISENLIASTENLFLKNAQLNIERSKRKGALDKRYR